MTVALLRLLPAAALAHIVEEFVWPGGFRDWYARYRPETRTSFTPRYAILVNSIFVLACAAPLATAPAPDGVALWLTMAALQVGNALFHLRATFAMREYSPGVVTATLLYLPLAAIGYAHFVRSGLASPATAVMAALLGLSYGPLSAAIHRARSRRALRKVEP